MSDHRVANNNGHVNNKAFSRTLTEEEKHQQALNKLYKECVKEWCENTTSHGFANMVRTDSWLIRIIWIILVVLFSGYCLYTVVIIIQNYLAYETTINYQIVYESPTEFPAITICNLNPFDVTTESSTGTYIQSKFNQYGIDPDITVSANEIGISKVTEASNILKASVTSDTSLNKTEQKKIGFNIETLIISCSFNGEYCNGSDFEWFRDHDYGNCYTFNALSLGDSKQTSKAGPSSGLVMELFVGAPGKQDFYTIKRGIKVAIHERGHLPMLKDEGINIGTNTGADIAIQKTSFTKLGGLYGDCRKDTETVLSTDSKYFKYSVKVSKYYQKLCFEICLQYEKIIPNCGCADPSIPIVDSNQTLCNQRLQLGCIKTQRDYFNKAEIADICGAYCPAECDSTVYSTSVSSGVYPTDYYASILSSQTNIISKFSQTNTYTPINSISNLNNNNNNNNNLNSGNNGGMPGQNARVLPLATSVVTSTTTTTTTTKTVTIGSGNTITTTSSAIGSSSSSSAAATTRTSSSNIVTSSQMNIAGSSSSSSGSVNGVTTTASLNSSSSSSFTTDDLKASVLSVSIYFSDLRYTDISESPAMTFEGLIGIVGGQFGLFMGASLLSFAEIAEMLINFTRIAIKYTATKRMLQKKANKIQNFSSSFDQSTFENEHL